MSGFLEYDRWNVAIADTLYSAEMAGLPAYLDLDEEALAALADALGIQADVATEQLLAAVRATVTFPSAPTKHLMQLHTQRLRSWRRLARIQEHPEPPPVLGMLAVAVLAAQGMGAEGGFPGFYKTFCALLGVKPTKANLATMEDSYRAVALEYWLALESWLSKHDGHHGLPTAYSLKHRYVGLAMSQAIVRQADRRRLPRMFSSFGLPPGYAMSASDMEGLLDQWIRRDPCPVSAPLRQLWKTADLRLRIADVAAQELQAWTGVVEESGPDTSGAQQIRLVALLVDGLTTRLDLTLGLSYGEKTSLELEAAVQTGGAATLRFIPSPGHLHQLDYTQDVALDRVMAGVLTLRTADSTREYIRKPRRIIPLRFDDSQAAYVESERVQLAEPSLVLVHDVGKFVGDVEAVLSKVARPGYRKHGAQTKDVPAGWVLFSEVEVMLRADDSVAKQFNELVPLASSQLSMHGGFKLPGRLQKWSSLVPPEIRAISQNSTSLRVVLSAEQADEESSVAEILSWSSDSGALFIDTSKAELTDGDYRLELFEGTSKTPTQQRELRLRSSDNVDAVAWFHAPRLWYNFGASGDYAVLSASPAPSDSMAICVVDGSLTLGGTTLSVSQQAPDGLWWHASETLAPVQHVDVPVLAVAKNSCLYTGAHYLEYPPFLGRVTSKYIDGVCRNCGLVRRSPAWIPRGGHGTGRTAGQVTAAVVISELDPVTVGEVASWDDAFDAVMHTGGGAYGWLERIGLQTGGTQLHVHGLVKALESLGSLGVERDSLAVPQRWEVAPRYLTGLSTGELMLTGEWRISAVERLCELLGDLDAELVEEHTGDGLTLRHVRGLDASDIDTVASQTEATYVPGAGASMLSVLPRLSEVAKSLQRVAVVGAKRIERFAVESAGWVSASHLEAPGSYRLDSGMGRSTVFRSADDVARGLSAPTTSYLAKHLAAQQFGRPLLSYRRPEQTLLVPRGAQLPGLYERAAVLCGGKLPASAQVTKGGTKIRASAYRGVPAEFADALYSLFLN